MTTAEQVIQRRAAAAKAMAPYGIPHDALRAYDLGAAIEAALPGSSGGSFEREISQELVRHLTAGGARLQGGERSVCIPPAVFFGSLDRDTEGAGRELMFERPGPAIRGPLRPTPRVIQLGATVADGPGDLRLVRLRDGWDPVWLPSDHLADDQEFEEMTLGSDLATVKTAMTSTVFSRELNAQSGVRELLEADVHRAVASLVDQAAIAGTGQDGQPLGLLNRDLPLAPALGSDGGLPTWEWLCGIERAADENTGAAGWLTNRFVREKLRQVFEGGAGRPAWRGGPSPGRLLGAPAYTSGNVPSNLTKGSSTDLSALIYSSDWSNLVLRIAGVELLVDPYSLAARGLVTMRIVLHAGIGLWHPDSFVVAKDIAAGSAGS